MLKRGDKNVSCNDRERTIIPATTLYTHTHTHTHRKEGDPLMESHTHTHTQTHTHTERKGTLWWRVSHTHTHTHTHTQKGRGPFDGESVAQLLLVVKCGKGFPRWILHHFGLQWWLGGFLSNSCKKKTSGVSKHFKTNPKTIRTVGNWA